MATVDELNELALSVAGDDGQQVVRVRGDVDLDTAHVLEQCLNELVDDGAREIVVDLADLTFIDTSGLSALVRTLKRLGAQEGRMVVRSPSRSVQKTLEITGLDKVLLEH